MMMMTMLGSTMSCCQARYDAAHGHGRRRHQHGEHQDREGLDLLGVVGCPGDEALGAEGRHFLGRKRLDLCEDLRPQLLADVMATDGAEIAGGHGGHRLDGRHAGHPDAQLKISGVSPADDAVIDDGGVHGGQEQVAGGLDRAAGR